MGKGKQTQYAPKKVPGGKLTGWKPSKQPGRVIDYGTTELLANSVPDAVSGARRYISSVLPIPDWAGSFVDIGGRRTAVIMEVIPHFFFTYILLISQDIGDGPLTVTLSKYTDGFAFDEVTYATCALCGPNIAHRKKALRNHQKTGQFVCVDCYDKLGVYDLESESAYRAEATVRLGDDFTQKSEWP
jgi:hypothetical protein